MRALASNARSTAPEFSTFSTSLSRMQWLSQKAMLDRDPGRWPGHHCCQWQHWQQCLSHRTWTVLSSAQALQASACHGWALLRSYGRSGAVPWPQWCGPMAAVINHCSATGIKLTNAVSFSAMYLWNQDPIIFIKSLFVLLTSFYKFGPEGMNGGAGIGYWGIDIICTYQPSQFT